MNFPARSSRLEVWGGVECTVARVRDRVIDEIVLTGHHHRDDDLDRFAALGLETLRFPVLWERTAPRGLGQADWSWSDQRLDRVRELRIRPIVGLMHHGSGPADTSLLHPDFPERLAEYAGAVARRYPWVSAYTPVNEPLTTARFSALYGHWHPHRVSEEDFIAAVLNQCRASILAMRAIRETNPEAAFVATEDLGKTYSNETLAYQAAFDNERRWLSLDLLAGRLSPEDRMWRHMRHVGVPESSLRWFVENARAPDLIGINHYVTSCRFLDTDLERYPRERCGGNGRHCYADVEAVRVVERVAGHEDVLADTWERYGLPLAVTETHLGGTREEQLRWLRQAWDSGTKARENGIDLRAVTAWALLGSFDWDSLLTRQAGHYEPGAFDVRGPAPRCTALGRLVHQLATGQPASHPVLGGEGWWRRSSRFSYGHGQDIAYRGKSGHFRLSGSQPFIIAGAGGTLGAAIARLAEQRGLAARSLSRAELDIADPHSVARAIATHRPWAIINAAGYVQVDDAQREPEACFRENTAGAVTLARACARHGIQLVTFSSDLVFDGSLRRPYVEGDPVCPLSNYGVSKADAERGVLEEMPAALVIRTSAFFGPWDSSNLLTTAIRDLREGRTCRVTAGTVSPTYVPDLVHATLDMMIDAESGIWHVANQGGVSWVEFVRRGVELAGLNPDLVREDVRDPPGSAPRPAYSVLSSERANLLPSLHDALDRYIADQTARRAPASPARVSWGA